MFLRALPGLLIISFGFIFPTLLAKEKIERPNILFIIVDDLRPELACYGADYVKSPAMDTLAKSGMLFTRAYCSSPVCGPSRVATLLGMRLNKPKQASSHDVVAQKLFPEITSIATLFKNAGYTTVTAGKTFHNIQDLNTGWTKRLTDYRFLENTPEQQNFAKGRKIEGKLPDTTMTPIDPSSFEKVHPKGRGPIMEAPDVDDDAYSDGQLATLTIKELSTLKKENKPFFFACGFIRPHLPFYAPKKYWNLYDRDKIPLAANNFRPNNAPKELKNSTEFSQYHLLGMTPGTEEYARAMKHGYLASVSYVDAQIGRVLDALKAENLEKDTIVVLWGDHGWNLGEHSFWGKHNLVDTATRVPLIIRVPGEKPGKQSSLVESIDIVPTLCELAHIPLTPRNGISLLPLIKNEKALRTTPAYSIFGQGKTVITDQYSYTSYGKGGPGHRMLFDRKKDHEENVNVAEDPEYADTIQKLHTLLEQGLDLSETDS